MILTNHAKRRIQQRGRSEADVAVIMTHGTRTRDGYRLRGRDADAQIRGLKKKITQLERLKN